MTEAGLFGGSFNPIHNGHIALAEAVRRLAGLDEVWFVVSPQNPLKQRGDLLDDNLRLEMVRKALEGHDHLVASDCELHLPRPSYTWDTLRHLATTHPDRRFSLIIGGDNWALFDRWYRHEDIIGNHRIIVYPRSGSTIDAATLPAGVSLVDTPLLDVSSTEIRRRIRCGEPIDGLVPDCIRQDAEQFYS